MRKTLQIFSLVLVVMMISSVAYAGDPSPWTEQSGYADQTTGKLDFGLKNLLGGWTEIFAAPYRAKQEDKNCIAGVGQGIVNAVVYTVGGAIHTGTFLIPIDVPIPNGGVSFD